MNLTTNEAKLVVKVEQAVPFFGVVDIRASLRYYLEGLGFEVTKQWVVDSKVRWCWLQRGGAALMLQEFSKEELNGKLGQGVSIYFVCNDALAIYREAVEHRLQPRKPFVGNAMWVVPLLDPDGYRIFFESLTEVPEGTEFSSLRNETQTKPFSRASLHETTLEMGCSRVPRRVW